MFEQNQRPAALEFLAGLFSGIGIILLTFLVMVFTADFLGKILPIHSSGSHFAAGLWAVLTFGLGVIVFRRRAPEHRRSSFTAGLVTAAALFLLLDAACWNFTFG